MEQLPRIQVNFQSNQHCDMIIRLIRLKIPFYLDICVNEREADEITRKTTDTIAWYGWEFNSLKRSCRIRLLNSLCMKNYGSQMFFSTKKWFRTKRQKLVIIFGLFWNSTQIEMLVLVVSNVELNRYDILFEIVWSVDLSILNFIKSSKFIRIELKWMKNFVFHLSLEQV